MTRVQFLNDLYRRLDGLTQEQAEQHLTYYAEMLADRIEEGMTEEEAVASMEPVDTIVQRIFEDIPPEERQAQPPSYPDLPETDGSRFTKVPDLPHRGRKSIARIILWIVAIAVALGATASRLHRSGSRHMEPTTALEEEVAIDATTDTGIAWAEEIDPSDFAVTPDGLEIGGIYIGPNGIHGDEFHIGPDGIYFYSGNENMELCGLGEDYTPEGISGRYSITHEPYVVNSSNIYEITVTWTDGAVEIRSWDGDSIYFYEMSNDPLSENQKLDCEENGGSLSIYDNVPADKGLLILVPANTFSYITVNTSAADVILRGVRAECAEINANSGDVTVLNSVASILSVTGESGNTILQGVGAGQLELELYSGDLIFNGASAYALEAFTTSGDISGLLAGEAVELETNSGNISVSAEADQLYMDANSGNVQARLYGEGSYVEVETNSGNVDLMVPSDADFTIEFDTNSGRLNANGLNLIRSNGQYCYGNGGSLYIEVETGSGNLNIRHS